MLKSSLIIFIIMPLSLLSMTQTATAQTSTINITTFDQAAPRLSVSEMVMREIYSRLNIELQLSKHPGNRALSLADEGRVDGDLIRTTAVEDITHNLIRIPTPIAQIKHVVYTKKERSFEVKGWGSLKPYKIGIIRGVKIIEERSKSLHPAIISSPKSLYKMLYLERINAAVFTELDGLFTLKALNLHHEIIKLSPPLEITPGYHYLHRKHAVLIEKLSTLMQEMEASGELQALIEKSENMIIDSLP
ncbi:substrate-binding periplasmic protein [Alkalimarinus alittae]|uniref:Transporter substrate-binding domain-containing protein n=1 Tax=Alkalimarinus alittae TaxID=2961619 RepID=A0ABY6N2N1_9ALTE|nr:transporter substrate-binding domain-containing protein [Alkalimarinus alittae]UZE96372.1 transporter substrate-binding domain-containing protein [Alkalimarinus alittae]